MRGNTRLGGRQRPVDISKAQTVYAGIDHNTEPVKNTQVIPEPVWITMDLMPGVIHVDGRLVDTSAVNQFDKADRATEARFGRGLCRSITYIFTLGSDKAARLERQ